MDWSSLIAWSLAFYGLVVVARWGKKVAADRPDLKEAAINQAVKWLKGR